MNNDSPPPVTSSPSPVQQPTSNGAPQASREPEPPPQTPPQRQQPPEIPPEMLAYMQEQDRQREMRMQYAQLYCAALTGLLIADPKANTINVAAKADAHAKTGMRLMAGGETAQDLVNRAQAAGGQPQQSQPAAMVPQYRPPPQNPYGGPPARGGLQPPGPGQTAGGSGTIPTPMGNFNYNVTYGPPPQPPPPPQQYGPQGGGGGYPPGYTPPGYPPQGFGR